MLEGDGSRKNSGSSRSHSISTSLSTLSKTYSYGDVLHKLREVGQWWAIATYLKDELINKMYKQNKMCDKISGQSAPSTNR